MVSAAVTGKNPEVVILFIVENPGYEWVVSREILTEYKEVLNRSRLKLTEELALTCESGDITIHSTKDKDA